MGSASQSPVSEHVIDVKRDVKPGSHVSVAIESYVVNV